MDQPIVVPADEASDLLDSTPQQIQMFIAFHKACDENDLPLAREFLMELEATLPSSRKKRSADATYGLLIARARLWDLDGQSDLFLEFQDPNGEPAVSDTDAPHPETLDDTAFHTPDTIIYLPGIVATNDIAEFDVPG